MSLHAIENNKRFCSQLAKQTEAIKLEETGLCFHGKLPEGQADECNMPAMERMDERIEILDENQSVNALVMVPKRTLDCSDC